MAPIITGKKKKPRFCSQYINPKANPVCFSSTISGTRGQIHTTIRENPIAIKERAIMGLM